ncbi:MAG: molybdenum-pterin-binding protein [Firmicutes bacterium]|nr:molybdenum-pterin-binding protein [Bacillota bacterium]MDF2564655.1 molybdenum-pterin-binding protein [Massilibacillus sp.]
MKISARNQLKGTVVSIQEGAVNAIVGIKIASGDIVTATVSMSSVKELGLEVGKEAYAIIKATSVMVGVE